MRLLITGICGFVGSELAKTLVAFTDSLEIHGIDNFSRSGSWLNRDILTALGIKVIHGDIRQSSDLETLGPFDWIIDCAANPSVLAGVDGKSSSRQLLENNLGGTINLLEACKRWKAGFLLMSTSRVYSIPPLANLEVEIHDRSYRPIFRGRESGAGSQQEAQPPLLTDPSAIASATRDQYSPGTPPIGPSGITESFSTAPPVSLYGATKLTSESLAMEYGLTFGFPVWINRCGVIAGARQFGKPDQGIFAFWLHSWREGRPLKYIGFDGLGHQVRDCLHPRDLAPLVLKQISRRTLTSELGTPIFNLSGGLRSAISLRQLSDWCQDRYPSSPTASSLPPISRPPVPEARPFDLPWVVLDHSLATRTWGWEPATTIETILGEIADFADANPDWISVSA